MVTIRAGWSGAPIRQQVIKVGGSKDALKQWEEVSRRKEDRKKSALLRKERKTKRVVNTNVSKSKDVVKNA